MRSSLEFRRASLVLASLTVLAGCATATRRAAVTSAVPSTRSSEPGQSALPKDALARAQTAYDAGDYPAAGTLFEAIVVQDSSPASIAVFRLATLRSWDNQFDEAIGLYRRYIVMEPRDAEGRLALARVLGWQGQYASAIAIYDTLIANKQRSRDAVIGRAQTLAWAGQLSESLAAYKAWLSENPNDRDASIEYARALAWNGQFDEAESIYNRLAVTGNAAARKGLARVIGWRGELDRSEQTWRKVLETDPRDPEALTGLAQVLSWQGRQTDAESALQAALRANPTYGDARTLLRWVQADLRPSATVSAVTINDSDHNRATVLSVDYLARAWWNGAIGGRYTDRSANFAAIDSRADAVNLFARWQPGTSSWQIRADGGVTRHSSSFIPATNPQQTMGSGALRLTGNVGRSLMVGISGSRAPFDETALLIANGVVSSDLAGEATLSLPSQLTLSGAASHARMTGGSRDNARNAFSSTLRWTASRSWSLAVGGRQFGYDTTSTDGYFAPKRYTLAEASGRGRIGGQLGWNADADVGLGRQSIEFFGSSAGSRLAERVAMSLGYRFDPSHEVSASGGYANVAGPGQTGSEYKWYTFSLRARVGF
jgi:tetratricopeptide (TPR) repeat protein